MVTVQRAVRLLAQFHHALADAGHASRHGIPQGSFLHAALLRLHGRGGQCAVSLGGMMLATLSRPVPRYP